MRIGEQDMKSHIKNLCGLVILGIMAGCGQQNSQSTQSVTTTQTTTTQAATEKSLEVKENAKLLNVGEYKITPDERVELLQIAMPNSVGTQDGVTVTVKEMKVIKFSQLSNSHRQDMTSRGWGKYLTDSEDYYGVQVFMEVKNDNAERRDTHIESVVVNGRQYSEMYIDSNLYSVASQAVAEGGIFVPIPENNKEVSKVSFDLKVVSNHTLTGSVSITADMN